MSPRTAQPYLHTSSGQPATIIKGKAHVVLLPCDRVHKVYVDCPERARQPALVGTATRHCQVDLE